MYAWWRCGYVGGMRGVRWWFEGGWEDGLIRWQEGMGLGAKRDDTWMAQQVREKGCHFPYAEALLLRDKQRICVDGRSKDVGAAVWGISATGNLTVGF